MGILFYLLAQPLNPDNQQPLLTAQTTQKWSVDPTTQAADKAAGVLVNGAYKIILQLKYHWIINRYWSYW